MKKFCLVTMTEVFLLLCTGGILAQETVTASGGNAAGSGGTVSFTVGQVACSINTSTSGTIIQGVQQPFEIYIVTSNKESEGICLQMSVYPNPTTDILTLTISDYKLENITYQLFDIKGRLIQNDVISDKETAIQTGNLAPAEYYMKIIDGSKELKVFKIIKN